MPCLEISMPKTEARIKEKLSKELTRVFEMDSGFDGKIFGIRFNEYSDNEAASGGKICLHDETRPYIHFLLYIPRIKREVKQKLVESFTRVFTECLGKPMWKPVIHINEHPYDNVGVEGKLLSDLYGELAERKFYYDTHDE
jgi:4-oxalocrotonate tautomerase